MTDVQPLVSVIIPLYNREDLIACAIDSVLAQTFTDFELIVIDDGSTDDGPEIVKQYDDQRIKIIFQQNAGPSSARNKGIDKAKGEWIAFLDSDDKWLEDKLQKQMELLERNPGLVWVGCNYMIDHSITKERRAFVNPEKIEKYLTNNCFFKSCFDAINMGAGLTPGTMIVKRSVLQEVGSFQAGLNYGEEFDLWWRIGYHYPELGFVNSPLIVYNAQMPGSLTASTKAISIIETLSEMFEKNLSLSRQFGVKDDIKPFIVQRLRKWSYNLYCQGHFKQIRKCLKTFNDILPMSFKFVMNILTMLPEKSNKHGRRLLNLLSYNEFEF